MLTEGHTQPPPRAVREGQGRTLAVGLGVRPVGECALQQGDRRLAGTVSDPRVASALVVDGAVTVEDRHAKALELGASGANVEALHIDERAAGRQLPPATLYVAQGIPARAFRRNAVPDISSAPREDVAGAQVGLGARKAEIASAEAAVELARIDLSNTVIRAPAAGRLGQVGVRLGQYVTAGTALVSHVSPEVWVIANFRETELHGIRVGDRATFTVDAMQHRAFTGRVEAFSPATASEFSILASSNTTGNFTKIAQRLPLRISIDPGQEMAEYLTPGLSVVVTVDEGSGARERSADAGRAVMGAV